MWASENKKTEKAPGLAGLSCNDLQDSVEDNHQQRVGKVQEHMESKEPWQRAWWNLVFLHDFVYETEIPRRNWQGLIDIKRRQEELKAALKTKGGDKNYTYQKYAEFSHLSSNNNSLCCSAINCLPHTLAIWGESITKQTGWNITFLVGRPASNQNGKIMSYL